MPAFILMGVSGSGKTTVGRAVAQALAIPFIEGDDFHSPANVAKMASGIALEDADRRTWIESLMQACNAHEAPNLIVACSALTHSVRARIRALSSRPVVFIHLTADSALIAERLRMRTHHFMKATLLPSQLATLEPSTDAILIDSSQPLASVCATVQAQIEPQLTSSDPQRNV